MQFLVLAFLACAVAVSAMPFDLRSPFNNPYIPPPSVPGFNDMPSGGSYLDRGFSGGSSGSTGAGYQRQGSNMFYDQGQNHNRVKQIMESESSSSHNVGGGSQGSSIGQSGGSFNTFGQGHLNTGRFSNYGPGMF